VDRLGTNLALPESEPQRWLIMAIRMDNPLMVEGLSSIRLFTRSGHKAASLRLYASLQKLIKIITNTIFMDGKLMDYCSFHS